MTTSDFLLRLCAAALAGLCIGFERQWQHQSAGLKTTMLVTAGAAIFTMLSIQFSQDSNDVDATRIIAQVVTGVGFLGAGIIFKEGFNVHGLTTAATIWCSAAIGCVAAAGFFMEAFISTALVLIVNIVLQPLDTWLKNRK
ncbi:MgtC/SapB family protein [Gelidibacter salicanalis]|uniref:MgtC/SapB family protein n=1 Tax=Gelidibacter salicanalis TaxID=291193 RepID=A0A5C7AHK9_9FLAO|nr:MgtC/SapB family protein [Gelidibacter salicanalis]TXE07807.1 MgtC/SapB family protein [Gelidibacter salicanalis]